MIKAREVHILLVEDDEVDVMNVRRAFRKNHITNPLHVAGDGIEALEMLRGEGGKEKLDPQPRICLLDINMPRMNGIEFLREVRADPELQRLSVFVLTTSDEERDLMAAYDLHVAGYILKPVDMGEFVSAVAALNLFWSINELP